MHDDEIDAFRHHDGAGGASGLEDQRVAVAGSLRSSRGMVQAPRGVLQRRDDVLGLQVGIVREEMPRLEEIFRMSLNQTPCRRFVHPSALVHPHQFHSWKVIPRQPALTGSERSCADREPANN